MSLLTFRAATQDDCPLLATLNQRLIQLFVVRRRRREGPGRAAVDILRARVWPRDRWLTVEVLASDEAAVAFWRAGGYTDDSLVLEIMPGSAR